MKEEGVVICAISDLHGYLPNNLPNSDLLLIGGDIVPVDIEMDLVKSEKWLREDFRKWILRQGAQKIVLIGGNHDKILEDKVDLVKSIFNEYNELRPFYYLINEFVELEINNTKLGVFGTPYCKKYGDWSFMLPHDELVSKFNECPSSVDIILSHDTPYGVSDIVFDDVPWATKDEHLGNKALRGLIDRVNFKILIHGHFHSSNHMPEDFNGSKVVNVSLVGEDYKPKYEPLLFRMRKRETIV